MVAPAEGGGVEGEADAQVDALLASPSGADADELLAVHRAPSPAGRVPLLELPRAA